MPLFEIYIYILFCVTGVAYPARMFNPKLAADGSWYFDKVFSDDEFIAAGQLVIPPSGRKPSKAAKDNTYVSTALSS